MIIWQPRPDFSPANFFIILPGGIKQAKTVFRTGQDYLRLTGKRETALARLSVRYWGVQSRPGKRKRETAGEDVFKVPKTETGGCGPGSGRRGRKRRAKI